MHLHLLRPLSYLAFLLCLLTGCCQRSHVIANAQNVPIIRIDPNAKEHPILCTPCIPMPPKGHIRPPLKPLIVLDPGHGGKDLGAHSTKVPKYQEKNLTLATVRHLKKYLEQMAYAVLVTRDKDVFLELEERSTFANERTPLLFVSMHYNSAPNPQADGIEIFYYKDSEDKMRTQRSKELGTAILKQMVAQTEAKSRGVKSANLAVIRETEMPAVLIEGGFLTNPTEVMNVKSVSYMKKLAWGIAQGINDYVVQVHPMLQMN